MYGAPRRTQRDAYAWLTAFVPSSPYPVTPAWAQQRREQPKNPPKFIPFSHGSSFLPFSGYGEAAPSSPLDVASFVSQGTSFVQSLVDSANATATAQTMAKRDEALAKWTSKAEVAKAKQEAEQSLRTQQTLLLGGGVLVSTMLVLFFATRKG